MMTRMQWETNDYKKIGNKWRDRSICLRVAEVLF